MILTETVKEDIIMGFEDQLSIKRISELTGISVNKVETVIRDEFNKRTKELYTCKY